MRIVWIPRTRKSKRKRMRTWGRWRLRQGVIMGHSIALFSFWCKLVHLSNLNAI
jgi:hypothetical protein